MTTAEYEKRIEKAREYQKRAYKKQLERVNSPEYKEKQRAKYLISIEKKRNAPHTPIKAKQKNARKSNAAYHSIFSTDMHVCHITGDTENVVPHHIFGSSDKTFSEKYGFILPIRIDWHEGYNYSIHKDMALNLKYKRLCQEYWLNNLGKTKEEWLNECSKWY